MTEGSKYIMVRKCCDCATETAVMFSKDDPIPLSSQILSMRCDGCGGQHIWLESEGATGPRRTGGLNGNEG